MLVVCVCVCLFVSVTLCFVFRFSRVCSSLRPGSRARHFWLRKNGVSTNGAAAKVMNFDRLRKKAHPGTLGKIKAG